MAVLPENMDKLDLEDPSGSLSIVENYIRYMGERIEFAMRNVTKSVSQAGISSAEMYVLLTAMSSALSALESKVGGMAGDLTGLTKRVGDLNTEVSSWKKNLESLEQRVAALEKPAT